MFPLLIVYDFDGVMTNNKVYLDQDGREMVEVNRADGLGIRELSEKGVEQVIISSEQNPIVSVRANKLSIDCFQGVNDKLTVLLEYTRKKGINLEKVAYIGNDINDQKVMEAVGMALCPSDAHHSIKKISKHILKTKGGDGVVREVFEYFIKNDS